MNEEIKEYIRKEADNKGNRIVLDLVNESIHVLDNKDLYQCFICKNHTHVIDEHHKDCNHFNDDPNNIIDICRFCHNHGIHGQSFYTHEWYETKIELKPFIIKAKKKDKIKFIFKKHTNEYIDFMANVSEHERAIEGIRYLIGIWLYEYNLNTPNQYNYKYKESVNAKGNKRSAGYQARNKF